MQILIKLDDDFTVRAEGGLSMAHDALSFTRIVSSGRLHELCRAIEFEKSPDRNQFSIGGPIQQPGLIPDIFRLSMEFVHGNAEETSDEIMDFDNTTEDRLNLLEAIRILRMCDKTLASITGGPGYNIIGGWTEVFAEVWHRDICCSSSIAAKLDNFEIEYIDVNCIRHQCNISISSQ